MPKNTQIAVPGGALGSAQMARVAGRGSLQSDPPLIALESEAGGQNFPVSTQSSLCTPEGPCFPHLSFMKSSASQRLHSPFSLKIGIWVIRQYPGEPTWILLARCLEYNAGVRVGVFLHQPTPLTAILGASLCCCFPNTTYL